MSIFHSKAKDGVLHVAVCGKLTRDPELKETAKGNKVKFSVCYGKQQYMDCDAWEDSDSGQIAGRLEKGDTVLALGIHRTWTYNDKVYQSLSVDGIIPVGLSALAAEPPQPTESETDNAGGWEELTEDSGDLPF